MKKVLVVVFAVALGLAVVQANAQVPYVQVYFDDYWTQTTKDCPPAPAGTVIDSAVVVAHNFNMWMNGIEYMVEFPAEIMWLGDKFDGSTLHIGSAPTGIGITWPLPGNAFGALFLQKFSFIWMCEGCQGPTNVPITVVKHPATPWPEPYLVRAVRWPDLGIVSGVGMNALICAVIPVEETTWGGIKAQFNN